MTIDRLEVSKTVTKIRQSYYWPGLQADVRAYIAGCDKCIRKKGFVRSQRVLMQLVPTGAPLERIATDILRELFMIEKGKRYIFVISYYYSQLDRKLSYEKHGS